MKSSLSITPVSRWIILRVVITGIVIVSQMMVSPVVIMAGEVYRIEKIKEQQVGKEEREEKPICGQEQQGEIVEKKKPIIVESKEVEKKLSFSKRVSDEEIKQAGRFAQRLIVLGSEKDLKRDRGQENQHLGQALLEYERVGDKEKIEPIEKFLEQNPQSVWRVSLLINLGIICRERGYMSRAVEYFEKAWQAGKGIKEAEGKALVDLGVGELAQLLVGLGKSKHFEQLMRESRGRVLGGSGRQKLTSAQETWAQIKRGERKKECGAIALRQIYLSERGQESSKKITSELIKTPTGPKGTSLEQLAKSARQVGLNYEAVHIKPRGAEQLPVPSIVHCRSGHYLAVVKSKEDKAGKRWYYAGGRLNRWISQRALKEEMSGYALVKREGAEGSAEQKGAKPKWAHVGRKEAQQVWGGDLYEACSEKLSLAFGDKHSLACGNGGNSTEAMADYTISALSVSLSLSDTPVGYSPAVGPSIYFRVNYNQRAKSNPASYVYSNFGASPWSSPWISYIEDDPSQPDGPVMLDQGLWQDEFQSNGAGGYKRNIRSGALLEKTIDAGSGEAKSYTLSFGDGSKKVFDYIIEMGTSRRVFLTKILDPAGNSLELVWNNGKLREIQDASGNPPMKIHYDENNPSDYKIRQVEDPFGRSAYFQYDGQNRLNKIQDVIGIESRFSYEHPNDASFISKLETPYGATHFFMGGDSPEETTTWRWIEVQDAMGARERVELRDYLPGSVDFYPPQDAKLSPNGMSPVMTQYSNHTCTFHWNKKQYQEAGLDAANPQNAPALEAYPKAYRIRWHNGPAWQAEPTDLVLPTSAIGVKAFEQAPLECPVYYNYQGQSVQFDEDPNPIGSSGFPVHLNEATYTGGPRQVSRVLQVTPRIEQLSENEYNEWGNLTKSVDAAGRTTLYTYASNGIDLLNIKRLRGSFPPELLASYSNYNAQHLPQTLTDAAGQTTTYTYNAQGQVTQIKDPKGRSLTSLYDGQGYLKEINTLGDGGGGPVPIGIAKTSFEYDEKKRIKSVTTPDNYTVTYQYDDLDRVIKTLYPNYSLPGQGNSDFSEITYHPVKKLDIQFVRDRLGRITEYSYDALRRVTQVQSLDKPEQKTTYTYCECGELEAITDAKGQTTKFIYDLMGRMIKRILPGLVGPAELSESYSYEVGSSRLATRTDALGQVSTYSYTGDDKLESITHSNAAPGYQLASDISFSYDPIYPRLKSYQDALGTTTYAYYPTAPGQLGAGKVQAIDGPLPHDTITLSYDELGRIKSRSINNSPETYVYDLLSRLTSTSNALGQFHSTYEPNSGRVKSITYPNGQISSLEYHSSLLDNRLKSLKHSKVGFPSAQLLSQYDYTYDTLGQIHTASEALVGQSPITHEYGYDEIGQLQSQERTSNGATSTIEYSYDLAGNRTSQSAVGNPLQNTSYAYNYLNQITSSQKGLSNPISYTYDFNGNLTQEGARKYTYDTNNQLCRIDYAEGKFTRILYNGLGQIHSIEEHNNNVVTSSRFYLWDGAKPCVEYDHTGATVTRRFFAQGERHGNGASAKNFFYNRDEQGSVRQLTDQSGNVVTAYNYSPWGEATKVVGSQEAAFTYAGYFYHAPSGLNLTWFRAYSPALGRWLTADPLKEAAGLNLYAYCGNDPRNATDPLGLYADPLGIYTVAPIIFQPGVGWVIAAVIVGVGIGYVAANMALGPGAAMNNCQPTMNFTQGDTGSEYIREYAGGPRKPRNQRIMEYDADKNLEDVGYSSEEDYCNDLFDEYQDLHFDYGDQLREKLRRAIESSERQEIVDRMFPMYLNSISERYYRSNCDKILGKDIAVGDPFLWPRGTPVAW